MINEIRTLLLNKSSENRPELGVLGEEYTNPLYIPQSTGYELLRDHLFSNSTDPLFQNYRLNQFMKIIFNEDTLKDYFADFDSRIIWDEDYFSKFIWGRTIVTQNVPIGAYIEILGDEPERTGRCDWSWRINYRDSDEVIVTSMFNTIAPVTLTLNFADGMSDVLTFPNQTKQTFRLRYTGSLPASANWIFNVSIYRNPVENLTDVLLGIQEVTNLYAGIFHLPQEQDLLNLWVTPQVTKQLAALLMGLILRTKEAQDD